MSQGPRSPARALVAAAALAAAGAAGCSLFESAQADKVLAATVLATPTYDLSVLLPDGGLALPFDSGVPLTIPDGGWTLPDAALPFTLPDGGIPTKIEAQQVAQIFYGQRNSDPTAAPKGIAGALVRLTVDGKGYDLKDRGEGNYSLTSAEDPSFAYIRGAAYDLSVVNQGLTHTAKVQAPAMAEIEQFEVLKNGGSTPYPWEIDANTPLQLTRRNTDNIAFTTVIPLSTTGQGDPTYTDLPTKPLDLLDLIANDAPWKRKVITIPGSAFPQPNTYYLVTIAIVKKGDTSTNLFTASGYLIGEAQVGTIKTR